MRYRIASGNRNSEAWEWATGEDLPWSCSNVKCVSPASNIEAVQVRRLSDGALYLVPVCDDCVRTYSSNKNGIIIHSDVTKVPL